MKRTRYKDLLDWKKSNKRKPLLLQGARQVGKTYLVNQFGENEYKDFIYLNFEEYPDLRKLFNKELNPEIIIDNISLYLGRKISSQDTLLFFDEIQEIPEAITSLKYFCEHLPEFHIIAAGSLLGVSVGKTTSFPVGKVNFMTLYPMSFREYLIAFNEEMLVSKMNPENNLKAFPEPIHQKLLKHLKLFMFLGGMPEVLQDYIEHKDISSCRSIQLDILESYKRDFSKYSDKNQAIKIAQLWESIPYQLAKENKKFKYSDVKSGARASRYEQTIEWLSKAGLINIAYNISVPKLPLAGYSDNSKFKIYMNDIGLLGAMLNISSSLILETGTLFTEYNGAFAESFVASELVAYGSDKLYYWTSKSTAEVDFLIQKENNIYPVEVKSGLHRNIKSLRSYEDKYAPLLMYRISPRNYIQSDNFINIPLYAVSFLAND